MNKNVFGASLAFRMLQRKLEQALRELLDVELLLVLFMLQEKGNPVKRQ